MPPSETWTKKVEVMSKGDPRICQHCGKTFDSMSWTRFVWSKFSICLYIALVYGAIVVAGGWATAKPDPTSHEQSLPTILANLRSVAAVRQNDFLTLVAIGFLIGAARTAYAFRQGWGHDGECKIGFNCPSCARATISRYSPLGVFAAYKNDVNATGKNGRTALHEAAVCESSDVAVFLLANGAKVDARDDDGNTPLHLVLRDSGLDVVRVLLGNKADINATNNDGDTPLHNAADFGSPGITEHLLNKKANVNARNNKGRTPLHSAVTQHEDATEAIKILLARGGEVNEKDNDGKTPLHLATCSLRNKKILRFLLNNGADVNAADNDGNTPLHDAAGSIDPWATKILLGKGADPSALNKHGRPPESRIDFFKSLTQRAPTLKEKP